MDLPYPHSPSLRSSRLDHSYLHSQWPLLIPWVRRLLRHPSHRYFLLARMFPHSPLLLLIPWVRMLLRNPLLP